MEEPEANEANEVYSNNSEECETYDIEKENEKIRDELLEEFSLNKKIDNDDICENDTNILDSFKTQYQLYSSHPNPKVKGETSSDPYTQIIELKKELAENSAEINEYVNFYKDNILLKEAENFDSVLKDLDSYKEKIESLIKSDTYKTEIKKITDESKLKAEIKATLESYTKACNDLTTQIAKQKKEIETGTNFEYELVWGSGKEENFEAVIKEMEEKTKKLEETIGKWDKFKYSNSIMEEVVELVNFSGESLEKVKEERDKKVKELEDLIEGFKKEKAESAEKIEDFLKIQELYSMLELYESFEHVFEYFKKRLKAVKTIHEESDSFNKSVAKLEKKIGANEKSFDELGKKFNETLEEFTQMESVIKELNEIEKSLNKMLVTP